MDALLSLESTFHLVGWAFLSEIIPRWFLQNRFHDVRCCILAALSASFLIREIIFFANRLAVIIKIYLQGRETDGPKWSYQRFNACSRPYRPKKTFSKLRTPPRPITWSRIICPFYDISKHLFIRDQIMTSSLQPAFDPQIQISNSWTSSTHE